MARFSLIPRQEQFFTDFVQLAQQIQTGARTLQQMLATDPPDMSRAQAIKDVEHVCDGLVRSIIEAMGGTITLESEVGHGTTFTTTLPRSPK